MISSITLNDASGSPVTFHGITKRACRTATGLLAGGIGATRDSRRVRPQSHGGIDDTKYSDGQVITLELEASSQVSLEDAYTQYRAMTGPMQDTLDTGSALLKWTEGNTGLQLQRLVKVMGEVDAPLQEGAAMLVFTAQFFAEDPRAYSQTLTTVTGSALSVAAGGKLYPYTYPRKYNPSSGGQAVCVNSGGKAAPYVLRVYGACTAPVIENVRTGELITLTGSIAAGDYLELDTTGKAPTVKLNGTINRANLVDSPNTTWWKLGAGSTTVQLLSSNFDSNARCDVLFRSAY